MFTHFFFLFVCFCSAGLQKHDVIVSINGKSVQSTDDVGHAVQSAETLSVTVRRISETVTFTVVPGELE